MIEVNNFIVDDDVNLFCVAASRFCAAAAIVHDVQTLSNAVHQSEPVVNIRVRVNKFI